MKAISLVAALFVVMLCHVAQAQGATPSPTPHLDIVLEGPWILYPDDKFLLDNTGTKTVPVLVAIAPDVVGTDSTHYHIPSFSMGNAFIMDTGIFCVGFDAQCAPDRTQITPTPINYPKEMLLHVKTASGWSWPDYGFIGNAYFIILPKPDSISNYGTWFMHFSNTFGTGYGDADGMSHSIGAILHYDSAATNISLLQCNPSKDHHPNASKCSKDSHYPLANTGTLAITMKSPESNNPCDNHVRRAYHAMIEVLDPNNDVSQNQNANQGKGYIDPARNVDDNGVPDYTDQPPPNDCFTHDPQRESNKPQTHNKRQAHKTVAQILGDQQKSIQESFSQLDYRKSRSTLKKKLFFGQLQAEFNELKKDSPVFDLSELAQLKQTLLLSADQAIKLSKAPQNSKNTEKLKAFATLARTSAYDVPTKDGKDCRAPIMIVDPVP